jgi:3-deoxy-D-manno-octulosonate 8-phosphate phosphatase (KDO 8-P phosphatase)
MNFKQQLSLVKAFAFDVDGVLSPSVIPLSTHGEPLRMINTKDGYAIRLALLKGFPIAIITGGRSEAVRVRFETLGVKNIYMSACYKIKEFNHFLQQYVLSPSEVLYMGDDIPDYQVMQTVGVAVCPADAAPEIKAIAHYVSNINGGAGCVRDVIEQTLKAQTLWMADDEAFGW